MLEIITYCQKQPIVALLIAAWILCLSYKICSVVSAIKAKIKEEGLASSALQETLKSKGSPHSGATPAFSK